MDDEIRQQIELLSHLQVVARTVKDFAHEMQADFINVRYENGLNLTWDAGELKVGAVELPGRLTLYQLEVCLAAWKGEAPYD